MTMPANLPLSGKSIANEWEFLCLSATRCAIESGTFSDAPVNLDWEILLELAEEHGMLGILATRLRSIEHRGVPAEAREKLQRQMRAQHLFTLSMTAELFRIVDTFKQAGIPTILVKGPLISLLAYKDPAVRSYVDLDLLVLHSQILPATQRMMEMGFEPDIPISVIKTGKVPGEYLFKRPGTKQIIELHTERTFRYYPRPMPLSDLFARKREVLLDGQNIPALLLEDEFILNSIHGAKHFWERLMWISDIATLVASHPEIDWNLLRLYGSDVGAERMIHVALQLAETVLRVPIPKEMEEEVRRDRAARKLSKQVVRWLPSAGYAPPKLRERALFRMQMRGGVLAGAAYLLRLSFSPTEEDWLEGKEENRSWLVDAMQRPMRLLRKYWSDK
jgi:hypothetical protein